MHKYFKTQVNTCNVHVHVHYINLFRKTPVR